MKRAEQIAWVALAGLIVIATILLVGAISYGFTAWWAGMMLVSAQALAVGFAAWGLSLARQWRELNELPPMPGERRDAGAATGAFRLSPGDDLSTSASGIVPDGAARTLDTSFQRLLVGITGFTMVALGAVAAFLIYYAYTSAGKVPEKPFPVAGSVEKPLVIDELGMVIGLSCAILYGVLYWLTRPKRTRETDDAVSSVFTLGISAMAALGVATVLGYFRVAHASEVVAGITVFFMLLQGFELIVNAFRSYSSIEELDQEAIDLQATPLGPMIGSGWLGGLRMLFAQSVGLSPGKSREEKGVVARMMPRALLAIVVLAIGASCLRVVKPGEVAVLERLGYAPVDADGKIQEEAILYPGLHVTLPWPMDQLVRIPTQELQSTNVGDELHAPKEWKGIDFQFWTVRGESGKNDTEDLFLTGDPGSSQLLETFIQVRWRVADPTRFYSALSHSEFIRKEGDADEATRKVLPIYEQIVQECTSFAVTRAFAIHSLEQIMITERPEVERHCREILQAKLDAIKSGIVVEFMTIKDLHPPYGRATRPDPTKEEIGGMRIDRGPAAAFEFVVSMREHRERLINLAEAERVMLVNRSLGEAASTLADAETYRIDKVARAHGEADRLVKMTEGLKGLEGAYQLELMKKQLLYATLREILDPVNKIIVDPSIKVNIIESGGEKGITPVPTPVLPGR